MDLLKSRHRLLSKSLFAFAVWLPVGANADDFVVSGNNPATVNLNGDDTLTVTESGSITPPTTNPGVVSTGGNNAITNSGSIETQGGSAHGIWNSLSDNSSVVNRGAIHTHGNGAQGIWNESSNNAPVSNRGSIRTEGTGAHGIWNDNAADSNALNSGSIHTSGGGSSGISNRSTNNSAVTNSGSIRTEGASNARGIVNSNSITSPITNSGSIYSMGFESFGIWNRGSIASPITNSGSIQTQGVLAHGIRNDGSTNSPVTNSGSILTNGSSSHGIWNDTSPNSPLFNSGSIRTMDLSSNGIFGENLDNSAITNSGTILTEAINSHGIFNSNALTSPITNSGSIRTKGNIAYGIWSFSTAESPITNTGSIYTEEADGYGIWNNISLNSPVMNSGVIHTDGSSARGILNSASANSPVMNSGWIHTKGTVAYGIHSTGSNNSAVTNSGYVVSEQSDVIRLNDADGELNLLAPAYLGGAINFDQAATVNITTGPSHSVLWQLPVNMVGGDPASVSGTLPWFYDSTTKQFATYDPSGLRGTFNHLGDMTGLLSQVGRAGLGSDSGDSSIAAYGQARVTSAFGNGGGSSDDNGFWITGFGGSIDHDGDASTLEQTIQQLGVAAGYSWQQGSDLQLNVMGGYLHGNIGVDSRFAQSQDIDNDVVFAGIFGERQVRGFNLDFGLVGGWLSSDSARFVNDNLALTNGLTLGQSQANGSYNSWFIAPEVGIGVDISHGDIIYTPSARLRYAMQGIDGYTESGSSANAQVGSRSLGMLEVNAEIAAAKPVSFGRITGRAGFLSRHSTGDEAVSVTLLGITNTVGFGDTDSHSAYLGLAADIDISPTTSLVFDGTGFFGGDMQGFQGLATFIASF